MASRVVIVWIGCLQLLLVVCALILPLYHVVHDLGDFLELGRGELAHDLLERGSLDQRRQFEVVLSAAIQV